MSTAAVLKGPALYESQEMLGRYMLMHWGQAAEQYDATLAKGVSFPDVVNLPITCAELVLRYANGRSKALDLGCAVARSSFEMARHFDHVTGIDFSHEFIAVAQQLKHSGEYDYQCKISGSENAALTAQVDPSIDHNRLDFMQGDVCNLPPSLGGFDAVLLANVLCRLPYPERCLQRMGSLLNSGGVLVMTTPLSWLPEYTEPSQWLSGLDDIARILTGFELLHQQELPFMIREHRRKYEYIITQASVWRRK